jgi:hypothetical protein
MKKYSLLSLLLIFLSDARAQAVRSCDESYSAKIVENSEIFVEHAESRIGLAKINHGISGGVFDSSGKLLIVYGTPNNVDLRSPQAEYLSIYEIRPTLRPLIKRTYGGGIYDVAIGTNSDLIFLSSRFGFDILNIKTMKINSFDPMSEPPFSRQQCERN